MLRVDKSRNAASLLDFRYHVQGNGRLTAGLRSVYLDNTASRHAAQSQGNVKTQRAGRNCLNVHIRAGISQLHHGSLTVCLLDLCQCGVKRLQLLFPIHNILHLCCFILIFSILLCFSNIKSNVLLVISFSKIEQVFCLCNYHSIAVLKCQLLFCFYSVKSSK